MRITARHTTQRSTRYIEPLKWLSGKSRVTVKTRKLNDDQFQALADSIGVQQTHTKYRNYITLDLFRVA